MENNILTKEAQRIIEQAEKLGITDFYKVRDLRMRDKYAKDRASGKSYDDTIRDLANDYHIACPSVVNVIFPRKTKKKKK